MPGFSGQGDPGCMATNMHRSATWAPEAPSCLRRWAMWERGPEMLPGSLLFGDGCASGVLAVNRVVSPGVGSGLALSSGPGLSWAPTHCPRGSWASPHPWRAGAAPPSFLLLKREPRRHSECLCSLPSGAFEIPMLCLPQAQSQPHHGSHLHRAPCLSLPPPPSPLPSQPHHRSHLHRAPCSPCSPCSPCLHLPLPCPGLQLLSPVLGCSTPASGLPGTPWP